MPFVLEFFFSVVVYTALLERKSHFAARLAGVAMVVCISTFSGMAVLRVSEVKVLIIVYSIFIMSVFIEFIAGIYICFDVRLPEAVYCATCSYITEHIAYCLRILLNELAGKEIAEPGSAWYVLIHASVYIAAYQMIAKKMVTKKHYETGILHSTSLMVVVLFIVYFMSVLSSIYGFGGIHAAYALICCLFMLFSQRNLATQLQMQKELHQKEQIWQKNKAQYEMSKETIEIINRKCHDLRHQIRALKDMDNLQKQKEVVEGIEESVMIYDAIKNTGNPILDTLLTEKGLLCKEHEIALNVIADGKLLDFMDEIDLYTLFGNALENAMEGNLRIEKPQSRYINLQIRQKRNLVLVRIENPYVGEIQMLGGLPRTVKAEKDDHGFGIRSIIHTAETYGGIVKIETENQIFVLRIVFPKEEPVV